MSTWAETLPGRGAEGRGRGVPGHQGDQCYGRPLRRVHPTGGTDADMGDHDERRPEDHVLRGGPVAIDAQTGEVLMVSPYL